MSHPTQAQRHLAPERAPAAELDAEPNEEPRPPRPPLVAATAGIIGAAVAMLVGGWLMLAPIALGYQPADAAWAATTHGDFWAGLGLAVLGAVVLVIMSLDLVGRLRAAGAIATKPVLEPEPAPVAGPPASSPSDELTALIRPLVEALNRDAADRSAQPPPTPPTTEPANFQERR